MKNARNSIVLFVLSGLLAATVAWSPVPEIPPREPLQFTGQITGWQLRPDGAVIIRLVGEKDGEQFSLWFKTPANQTTTTRFEDHVVEAMLTHFADGPGAVDLQVTSDRGGNEVFGRSPADALPMSSLSRME